MPQPGTGEPTARNDGVGTGVGPSIRARRRALGLTQRELASQAGISVGTVRDLEQGRTREPGLASAGKLARALRLDGVEVPNLAEPAGRRPAPPSGDHRSGPRDGLRLRVLGPLEVWRDRSRVGLGQPMQRAVLGLLALNPGIPVHRETIINVLWRDDPPATAVGLVQAYVSRLRRLLDPGRSPRDPGGLLVSGGTSYRLRVTEEQLDLLTFRRLAEQARAAVSAGELNHAHEAYECALGMWRGAPFDDVDLLRNDPAVTGLRRVWAQAVMEHAAAANAAGRPERALPYLRELTAREPLEEKAHALLMIALAEAGQQAAAIEAFEGLRRRLDDQLGVPPGPEVAEAHLQVLRQDIRHAGRTEEDTAKVPVRPSAAPVEVRPAQLPADVYAFAGRSEHLARLDDLLAEAATQAPTAVVISAVSGTAGVGKTALAVRWAHRVAHHFPDGQLYVNLHGFDAVGRVMAPADAVRGFLDALGVVPERIPASLDAQAALYRSLLAGRRVLIVLDNARDADQVRPLLPGTPTALVVVTSRNQLTPLVAAEGAHPLALDILSAVESRELLARRLGAARIVAEPEAVEQIAAACAGLPLALAIVAARAQQSGFPLAVLAAEMGHAGRRLDVLDAGDATSQVRAVFSWSHTALTPAAARLFRLLGQHPGPDVSAAAAASLAGHPLPEARRLLAELTRSNMLSEHIPSRYTFHDLLRAYASDLTPKTDNADRAAVTRLLDHYAHAAHAADRLLNPQRDPMPLPLAPPAPGTVPVDLADYHEAMTWLAAEHRVLIATLRYAAETGFHTHAWQLAWALDTFLNRLGHRDDTAAAWQIAQRSADHLGNPNAQAAAHRLLAYTQTWLGRHDEANANYQRALDLYSHTGDQVGLAHTHQQVAFLSWQQGKPDQALAHDWQALTLFRAAGHRRGEAFTLNAVGWCHVLLGEHTQALSYCEQALPLNQQLGDRDGEASTWDTLGYAHHHLSHHSEAVECYNKALALFHDLGDRYYESLVLSHLGDAYQAAGDNDAARTAWRKALRILTELDHVDAATVRAKLGELDRHLEMSATGTARG